MPMQWRGRYHALVARSASNSRSKGSPSAPDFQRPTMSAYHPQLSVEADIADGQPSAKSRPEQSQQTASPFDGPAEPKLAFQGPIEPGVL